MIGNLAKSINEPLVKVVARKAHKRAAYQASLEDAIDLRNTSTQVKKELDMKLLRLVVMEGLPFRMVDSPWFLDFVQSLRPNYWPVGSSWLASGLMLKEQARAKQALQERTLAPENLTVSVDGWTDQAKHSVYACTLSFPDGTTALFDAVDLSEETHSGKNLAEHVVKWIQAIGRERVAALCTDNAANMVLMRNLVVKTPSLTHIVEYRCMMHSFSLLIGSILGHEWSKELVANAQLLVCYFRAAHKPLGLLRKEASRLGIRASLARANATRFTSVHMCLESVHNLQRALLNIARESITSKRVLELLDDAIFWIEVGSLCKLLEPFSQAVMAIQSDRSSMADVTRYWIYLARVMRTDIFKMRLPDGEDDWGQCCRVGGSGCVSV